MDQQNMQKIWKNIPFIMNKMSSRGILLVTGNKEIGENVMTLGWAQFGYMWDAPIVDIFVRPSRYTYSILQKHNEFTLNVMSDLFNNIVDFCGQNSGKFCDKFKETGLEKMPSQTISTPSIKNAEIIVECQTLHATKITPENLNDIVLSKYYANKDFHYIFTAVIKNFYSVLSN